jgi:two-component sensor histidine kinase
MKISFFYAPFMFLFFVLSTPSVSVAQNAPANLPHLKPEMIKKGMLSLKFKGAWRYQKGDDIKWADPDFDDSQWHPMAPDNLRAYDIPDSLWQGYGWWRLSFTADSAIYEQVSHLYFRGWGAAEVFLDGKKVHTYGLFSNQPQDEKNYVPRYVLEKEIRITPANRHVLAVRYSNHQAKKDRAILKHNAPYLGFSMAFVDETKATDSEHNYAYYVGSHAAITAILLLLLLIHMLLFIKFPKDKSNLAILLVVSLFLMSVATNYAGLFIEITGFRNSLIRGFANSTVFGLGIVLLPYTLALLFRLEQFYWTKYFIGLVILRVIIYFYPIVPIIYPDSIFIIVVFIAIGILMYQAIKNKKPSVHYVTAGTIGTTVFLLIDRLYATSVIDLSNEQFYIVVTFVFLCFPIGLSLYITSRYGSLFYAMEKEVAERTSDLNLSLQNLTSAQTQLTAKNEENELLLKEIHHRVKNNLEVVTSLLQLQTAQIDDPSVQAAMLSSQNRVHSMGIIHQKLYQGEHLAAIEMRDYFINLSESILDSFNTEGRVKVECDMPKLVLDVDTAISIGLITNELITNSLKYAFENKDTGMIKISMKEQNTEGGILLKISDNGIGKPVSGKAKGTGFGTQLINLLTKQLDGQLTYEINNGTSVSLAFKKPKLG